MSLLCDARKVTGMIGSDGVQAWEFGNVWKCRHQKLKKKKKQNSVAFSLQANYTDRATAACRRNEQL
jgi:hypothetical protein